MPELSGQERVFSMAARSTTARFFARRPDVLEGEPMAQDFIFAHDVILDPDTAKVVAEVRNGGVWRNGTRIFAVLVGAHMHDLNGNLLGKLAGDGSLPISFKNLAGGKSAPSRARLTSRWRSDRDGWTTDRGPDRAAR
jgi:hypothetical protein